MVIWEHNEEDIRTMRKNIYDTEKYRRQISGYFKKINSKQSTKKLKTANYCW